MLNGLSYPHAQLQGESLNTQKIRCLLTHKCNDEMHEFGRKLAMALDQHGIELLIDRFEIGDVADTRMKTFDFDALLFLLSPESWASEACQLELETARRREAPIFIAHLSGDVPEELRRVIYWKPCEYDGQAFAQEIKNLALAIRAHVSLHQEILLLSGNNPPDITLQAARNIYEAPDRAVVAEYAGELAKQYRQVIDPSTRFWIALALGRAGTPEAATFLRALPTDDHPYPVQGIRKALEMVARGE
jgi:hypothetical protein